MDTLDSNTLIYNDTPYLRSIHPQMPSKLVTGYGNVAKIFL